MIMIKLLAILAVALSAFVAYIGYTACGDGIPPQLPDYYWGPSSGAGNSEDTSIRPFQIKVDDKILADLKNRLTIELSPEGNRFTKPLEGIGFEYGFNTDFLKTVTSYWLEKYDWKVREKEMNTFAQFKTKISGIDIHFLHVKGGNNQKYKKTLPLLLVHGWPGSFVEFLSLIPLLTDPLGSDINFELVIPSIPGYGFSEAAHKPGLGAVETAQIFQKLMKRLKFDAFYTQGGDWGSLVTTLMGGLYPKQVKGVHLNLCSSQHPRSFVKTLVSLIAPSLFLEKEEVSRSMIGNFGTFLRESGYMHLQGTKPDTVGVSLSNSPTGLAAYILEKFSGWTDIEWISRVDGGLIPHFKLDDLLDNVMVYWVTNSITSSMRFYAENLSKAQKEHGMDSVPVKVPTACLNAPKEFFFSPRFTLDDKFPQLIQYTNAEKGGHFTAFEVPDILAKDVLKFVKLVESKQ